MMKQTDNRPQTRDFSEFFKTFETLPDAAKVEILDEIEAAGRDGRQIDGGKIAGIVSKYPINEN